MTFLNPTLLFGLLAGAIPLVLHFINLRKLKKVEFSTLVFLKELQKTKIKQIKLKQFILLLIRMAIILLLVMAFARPTIKNISFGSSSAVKSSAVIIIDNTYSMSLVTEKGSKFNCAKQAARDLINNFQEGDEIELLPVAEIRSKERKPTTNFSAILNELKDLQISPVSRTLNEVFVNAVQILEKSQNYNREIYFLTDLQKGRISNSQKEISDFSKSLNSRIHIYLVNMPSREAVNLGVEDIQPENQIFEKGKSIGVSAKIRNYSSRSVSNSVVSLFLNGKRSAQQSVNFNPGEAKEILFETTIGDTGLIQMSVQLEDDDILQDNQRSFSVYVPEKLSLLLLTDNREDSKFIKLAVADPTGQHLKIFENNLSSLSSINFAQYDAVFIVGSETVSDISRLKDFVKNGGGAVIMPGSKSTLSGIQSIINGSGFPASVQIREDLKSAEMPFGTEKINSQNPLFADLFEKKKDQQIGSPQIYRYFKAIPGSAGKNILSMNDNSSFLSEYAIGNGKVFFFNTAPLPEWNDFSVRSLFAPMMNKLFLICASKSKLQNSILAGDGITADISNRSMKQIVIHKPGKVSEYLDADSLSNKNYLAYDQTDKLGTYQIVSDGKLLDYFTVNHDPRESVLEKASLSEFEKYLNESGFSGKLYSLQFGEDLTKMIYQSRFGSELWKYFLVVILLLALAESIIGKSSKKDLAALENRKF